MGQVTASIVHRCSVDAQEGSAVDPQDSGQIEHRRERLARDLRRLNVDSRASNSVARVA